MAEPAGGGGATLPQLDVSTYSSQIFWLIVSFALLYLVVRSLASPRLRAVAGNRARRIGGDIEAAEQARAVATERDAEQTARLAAAHEAARAEMARAAEAASAKSSAELAALNTRLMAETSAAETALAARRAAAAAELEAAARELAGDLVERFTAHRPLPGRLATALREVR